MGSPGFGDLSGQLIIIRQQNKVIRMVAVLHEDRHALRGQCRRNFPQLTGPLLPEPPDDRLTHRLDVEPTLDQHATGFFSLLHQEVGVCAEDATAFQPYAMETQQLPEARQLASSPARRACC